MKAETRTHSDTQPGPSGNEASQYPKRTLESSPQVDVPSMQSLHTRFDDSESSSHASTIGEEDKAEAQPSVFSHNSPSSIARDGCPLTRHNTKVPPNTTRSADGFNKSVSEIHVPSHAPDDEPPLLFSSSSFATPPEQQQQQQQQQDQRSGDSVANDDWKINNDAVSVKSPPAKEEEDNKSKDAQYVEKQQPSPTAPGKDPSKPPILPTLPPDEPIPDSIEFLDNPDDDGYGLRSLLEAITNPQLLLRIQYGFRTILLVTLPLYTIALHPNTRYRLGFPQMLIASVVSTSTHRPTVGEQIGLHSWTWRGIIFMLIWGTAVDAWNVAYHVGAWYGLLAAGIFAAGLVNNSNMRRFMFLYFFLYMLELRTHQHYFSYVPMNDAAYSAADYLLGSVMGVAANTIPFPALVRDTVDMILTKIFAGFGKLLFGMISYTWSADVHAAAMFFSDRTPFITIEAVLSHMSALLWFSSWEPMEFPLRNPIRRVKLALLRRLMALGYAAFSCGYTIAVFRQQQEDRIAMHRIRCQLYSAAHGTEVKALENAPPSRLLSHPDGDGGDVGEGINSSNAKSHSAHDTTEDAATAAAATAAAGAQSTAKASMAELRANSYTYVKDFAGVLMQAITLIGSTESTPEQLIKKVPFDLLREKDTVMRRNLRLETLQVMKIQSEMVAQKRAREQQQRKQQQRNGQTKDNDDDEDGEGSGTHVGGDAAAAAAAEQERNDEPDSSAHDSDNKKENTNTDHAPYGAAHRYNVRKADARLILEHRAVIDTFEVFLRINEIFFHLLLGMIAGEIINFGEQMREYKPTESLLRRGWRHYIVEAWDGFWSELWCRVTLARPTDYRTVKDSIRMTCAYLSATALNIELWKPLNGLYFFGVTPLLGLPVEEESLGLGICRIGGNTMGCALGYMAYHNTTNFAQQIAMTLCFAFIQQVCKYHAQYGQFFFYGSVITLAGLATATIFNELVVRLVTSSYTVMAYLMCCLFLFPNDCRKICFNYRCKLTKVMSETIDDVALTARLTIEYKDNDDDVGSDLSGQRSRSDGHNTHDNTFNEPVTYPSENTEPMQMCSQLNIELTLMERLLMMCEKWTPFAATELVIRGMAQFPTGPNALITFAHERMVANLRLLVFGVQLLHRPRATPPTPTMAYFIQTSLSDFLDDFADAVRLVGVDHVHALQRSRTWSYPAHLSRVSRVRRLRVRLHALMYECYVLVANNATRGTFGMTPADFDEMRRAGAAQRELQAKAATGAGDGGAGTGRAVVVGSNREARRGGASVNLSPPKEDEVHMQEDLSFLPGVGGNPVNGTAAPPGSSTGGKPQSNISASPTPAPIDVRAGEDITQNMSFVDRYLAARRDEELDEEARTATTGPSRRPSTLATSSPADALFPSTDANHPLSQQASRRQDVPPSTALPHAFSTPGQSSLCPTPRLSGGEGSPSVAASFAGRRRPDVYIHRAHLQQTGAAPTDAWPPTIESAEHEVQQMLKDQEAEAAKKKQQQQQQGGIPAREGRKEAEGDESTTTASSSSPAEFVDVLPSKDQRNVSKLILCPDKGAETYIPPYRGPGFTFMEDALDMPADTDFAAVSTILLSCGSIMEELEGLPGSLNSLTTYDKQLQESSVATAFLDTWSAKVVGHRKNIHDRYHFPKPSPPQRRPLHAQEDPFEDWKF